MKFINKIFNWIGVKSKGNLVGAGKNESTTEPRVLIIELLETPWWVLDEHAKDYPASAIAKLMSDSIQLSVASEQNPNDLRYWVSSASLMRGVGQSDHQLAFLNQHDSMAYPPIWTLAAAQGKHVGVWGTAYSHEWKDVKSEIIDFYLPDKFSPDNFAKPRRVVAYQRILRLLSSLADKGVEWSVSSIKIQLALMHFFLSRAIRLQFGAVRSFFRNDGFAIRFMPKTLLGARLAFYEFMSIYPRCVPSLATLSLGFMATALHLTAQQYLSFQTLPQSRKVKLRSRLLLGQALHELDFILNDLMKLAKQKSLTLIFVSGYGQVPFKDATVDDPVFNGSDFYEMWVLNDWRTIRDVLGIKSKFKLVPSMFPCSSLVFDSNEDRDEVLLRFQRISCIDFSNSIFSFEIGDRCLSVKFSNAFQNHHSDKFKFNAGYEGGKIFNAISLGFKRVRRNKLYGNHAPGGIMMIHGEKIQAENLRQHQVNESAVARIACAVLNIAAPSYMDVFPLWLQVKLKGMGVIPADMRQTTSSGEIKSDIKELIKLFRKSSEKVSEADSHENAESQFDPQNALNQIEKYR
jgi:hypothetical protein